MTFLLPYFLHYTDFVVTVFNGFSIYFAGFGGNGGGGGSMGGGGAGGGGGGPAREGDWTCPVEYVLFLKVFGYLSSAI